MNKRDKVTAGVTLIAMNLYRLWTRLPFDWSRSQDNLPRHAAHISQHMKVTARRKSHSLSDILMSSQAAV